MGLLSQSQGLGPCLLTSVKITIPPLPRWSLSPSCTSGLSSASYPEKLSYVPSSYLQEACWASYTFGCLYLCRSSYSYAEGRPSTPPHPTYSLNWG